MILSCMILARRAILIADCIIDPFVVPVSALRAIRISWTSAFHASEVTQHAEVSLPSVVMAGLIMIFSFSGSIGINIINAIFDT